MSEGVLLGGYADGITLLVTAQDVELAQFTLNQAIRRISCWLYDCSLNLALNKMEIIILSKSRIATAILQRIGDERSYDEPGCQIPWCYD